MAPLRSRLGYRDDELVCVVAVGGSGVGRSLIEKVVAVYPLAKKAVPELRMIVSYRDVETDGAARAAQLIAELV